MENILRFRFEDTAVFVVLSTEAIFMYCSYCVLHVFSVSCSFGQLKQHCIYTSCVSKQHISEINLKVTIQMKH